MNCVDEFPSVIHNHRGMITIEGHPSMQLVRMCLIKSYDDNYLPRRSTRHRNAPSYVYLSPALWLPQPSQKPASPGTQRVMWWKCDHQIWSGRVAQDLGRNKGVVFGKYGREGRNSMFQPIGATSPITSMSSPAASNASPMSSRSHLANFLPILQQPLDFSFFPDFGMVSDWQRWQATIGLSWLSWLS